MQTHGKPSLFAVDDLAQTFAMAIEGSSRKRWSEEETVLALYLYFQLPFGKLHSGNPEIQELAAALGRTNSSVAMKLCNFASLDPKITDSGRKGLDGASKLDRAPMRSSVRLDRSRLAGRRLHGLHRSGNSTHRPHHRASTRSAVNSGSDLSRRVHHRRL